MSQDAIEPTRVWIDVGGLMYETTSTTLKKSPVLKQMLASQTSGLLEPLFIDRDGAAFMFVLLDPSFACGQAETRGTGNFGSWDINKDGVLTREEVPPGPRRMFDRIDTNGDGKVTFDEHRAGGRQPEGSPRRANSKNTNVRRFTIRQSWSQEPNGLLFGSHGRRSRMVLKENTLCALQRMTYSHGQSQYCFMEMVDLQNP